MWDTHSWLRGGLNKRRQGGGGVIIMPRSRGNRGREGRGDMMGSNS